MHCKDARILLGAWIDGEEAPGVADHAKTCEPCSAEAEFLRSLKNEMRKLPRPKAPPGLRQAVRPRTLPWRWPSAAAAAVLVVAVVLLALPQESSGLPDIVLKSSGFYDDLLAGRVTPEECETPAEIRDYFHNKLGVAVNAPDLPGSKITGGCPCDIYPQASPWIVYDIGGDILSLLVFEGKLTDLPESALRTHENRNYYAFQCGKNTIVLCATGDTAHLWISRFPEKQMVDTILATPEGRRAMEGVRLTVREVT